MFQEKTKEAISSVGQTVGATAPSAPKELTEQQKVAIEQNAKKLELQGKKLELDERKIGLNERKVEAYEKRTSEQGITNERRGELNAIRESNRQLAEKEYMRKAIKAGIIKANESMQAAQMQKKQAMSQGTEMAFSPQVNPKTAIFAKIRAGQASWKELNDFKKAQRAERRVKYVKQK